MTEINRPPIDTGRKTLKQKFAEKHGILSSGEEPRYSPKVGRLLAEFEVNRSYYDRISSILGVGKDSLDDARQATLLHILQIGDKYDETKGTAKNWISTVHGNRLKSEMRTEKYQKQRRQAYFGNYEDGDISLESPVLTDDSPEGNIEEAVTQAASDATVRQSLEALNEDHLRAVELVFFSGFTSREAGGVLGISDNTVKTRVKRSKEKLAQDPRLQELARS